jgi:hypothetical protein
MAMQPRHFMHRRAMRLATAQSQFASPGAYDLALLGPVAAPRSLAVADCSAGGLTILSAWGR